MTTCWQPVSLERMRSAKYRRCYVDRIRGFELGAGSEPCRFNQDCFGDREKLQIVIVGKKIEVGVVQFSIRSLKWLNQRFQQR